MTHIHEHLWANGYRSMGYHAGTKYSTESNWQLKARRDPPVAVARQLNPALSNTGILCDALRPIDVDLTDPDLVARVTEYCTRELGVPLVRFRANSPKVLLLYAAAEGSPAKRIVKNDTTKERIEVLGFGSQFTAFGTHPTGAAIEWQGYQSPLTRQRSSLTAISEEQVDALLSYGAALIEATVRELVTAPLADRLADTDLWPIRDLCAALDAIPNSLLDWDLWFGVLGASHHVSAGSAEGFAEFEQWSAKCPDNRPATNRVAWSSLSRSGKVYQTGGTLVWHARQAIPDWVRPSRGLMTPPRLF